MESSAQTAVSNARLPTRQEIADQIVAVKMRRELTWTAIAKAVGQSREWTTSALLGQQGMSRDEARKAVKFLGLEPAEEIVLVLSSSPSKGALGAAVPTDPLIYRFYEILQVYGPTLKEIIHEDMGDGIMSAIDYTMNVEKVPDPKGDRVKVTLCGKFLGYKKW
jgi:cyanate lyase